MRAVCFTSFLLSPLMGGLSRVGARIPLERKKPSSPYSRSRARVC